MDWKVAALYRFVPVPDVTQAVAAAKDLCAAHGVCGTLLIAPEGVNGTIAAAPAAMTAVIDGLDELFGVRAGELKYSTASARPFRRLKVRKKKEIITMHAPEADPHTRAGTYVAPKDWNALIADPDVLVLDTRNDYEVACGTFAGAVDPQIKTFTGFKNFVQNNLNPAKHRKVAMFCTGGIRCEKASAYMRAHGFDTVYHLKGGILQYLEDVPQEQSLWQGTCFVFDEREELGHGLREAKK